MNDFILDCQHLSKVYHDGAARIEVLRDINLQVKPGEMVSIVGISGSGKSTLLHLLGGLDKPTGGEIKIAGKNLATLSENEKCHLRNINLGFVYQFHHLLPEFTALENVCMPLLIRGVDPEIASENAIKILDMVQLKKRLTHKVGELSGGERQRVAIARALVTNPLCVLADEPTGNLDPRNAERVLELFLELQRAYQSSVIMVTHDRGIARMAHRMLTIEDGKLVSID